jgi:hypothetical protein
MPAAPLPACAKLSGYNLEREVIVIRRVGYFFSVKVSEARVVSQSTFMVQAPLV